MITLAHEEEWPVRGVLKRSPYCTACRPPTSKDRKCGDSAEFVVGARAFSAELGNSLNATGPASLYTTHLDEPVFRANDRLISAKP